MNLISLLFWRHTFPLESPCIYNFIIQTTRSSFPHRSNSISRCSYNETLCCLERGHISDDVLVSRAEVPGPSEGCHHSVLLSAYPDLLFCGSKSKSKSEVKKACTTFCLSFILPRCWLFVCLPQSSRLGVLQGQGSSV